MADKTEGAHVNVAGPATTKRRKRSGGPRKDLVVLAELRLFNADGTVFEPEPGMRAQAFNISKDLTKWAIDQAEGNPATALKVVIRVPQSSPAQVSPNGPSN